MKILWLYKYLANYDFDNWLHVKFAETLARYPEVELITYGPDMHLGYPSLTPIKFDSSLSMGDLLNKFQADVVIMNTKSRMFMEYNPYKKLEVGEWTPVGLRESNVPKVVIEEDYHYETDDEWYCNHNVDLILQRHYSQSLRQQIVPMMWLPFSIDPEVFRYFPFQTPRIEKICFAGSTNSGCYIYRDRAWQTLTQHPGLIEVFARKEKTGNSYIECLRDYICHLSCSSTYNLSSAKMFEIMASGSVLFTNENFDLPLLFPPDSYVTYKNNWSDLLDKAKRIVGDRVYRNGIVKKGLETIRHRHTHEIRIQELLIILEKVIRSPRKNHPTFTRPNVSIVASSLVPPRNTIHRPLHYHGPL